MTTTTTANVGAGIPTIVAVQIVKTLRENNLAIPFFHMRSMIGTPGATTQVSRWSTTLATTAITTGASEGAAQTPQQVTSDSVSLTAAAKAIHVDMSQFSKDVSAVEWNTQLGQEIGRCLATKLDVDALALLSGGSNSTGSTGATLTFDDLIDAAVGFRQNAKERAAQAVGILATCQYGDLMRQAKSGVGPSLATVFTRDDVISWFGRTPGTGLMTNQLGMFLNIPWFQSENAPTSGGDRVGAIFARNVQPNEPDCAFGGVIKWAPEVRVFDAGVNYKLTDIHQGRVAHGFGELKDELVYSIPSLSS